MRKLLTFLLICSSFLANAQQAWVEKWRVSLEADDVWDIDQAGNVYLVHQQSISKRDTTGKQLLTQSIKSIGTIAKIDASNWLKIAIFSEEQQQICYLDNALGIQPNCLDLSEWGINLAQNFATSNQTDRIWVYDQLNSELQLITTRNNQRQIVQNLRSLVDIGNVVQLMEFQNKLYLLDNGGNIITFDNFGTFLGSITIPATHIQPYGESILASSHNRITFSSEDQTEPTFFFELDDTKAIITQFHLVGKRLYVSTTTDFYCFQID